MTEQQLIGMQVSLALLYTVQQCLTDLRPHVHVACVAYQHSCHVVFKSILTYLLTYTNSISNLSCFATDLIFLVSWFPVTLNPNNLSYYNFLHDFCRLLHPRRFVDFSRLPQ